MFLCHLNWYKETFYTFMKCIWFFRVYWLFSVSDNNLLLLCIRWYPCNVRNYALNIGGAVFVNVVFNKRSAAERKIHLVKIFTLCLSQMWLLPNNPFQLMLLRPWVFPDQGFYFFSYCVINLPNSWNFAWNIDVFHFHS